MNVAKFFTTVLFTALYTSAIWLVSLYDEDHILFIASSIAIVLFSVLAIVSIGKWVVEHWNDK